MLNSVHFVVFTMNTYYGYDELKKKSDKNVAQYSKPLCDRVKKLRDVLYLINGVYFMQSAKYIYEECEETTRFFYLLFIM